MIHSVIAHQPIRWQQAKNQCGNAAMTSLQTCAELFGLATDE